jgi:LysR family transcriptional regulator, chromosome initiation inhibitor
MLDREQLETFARVAEEQSFERAACVLNVSRGAVSQRVKSLEEALAAVLLVREKPVVPTPAGVALLRHVKAMRLLEGALFSEIAPKPGPGTPVPLSIAVNADSLATWFADPLWDLLRQGHVALEIVTDDQDHTTCRLARGEVIGCVSTEAHPAAGFIAQPLGAMEYRCYATPGFARASFPKGLTVPSILAATAVLFNRKDSLHDEFLRALFDFAVDRYPRHYLPSPLTLLEGVAAGVGYGLVPSLQAGPLVARGDLVDLAPGLPVLVHLYWHHWELEPPLAQGITAHIVARARTLLLAPSSEAASSPGTGPPACLMRTPA